MSYQGTNKERVSSRRPVMRWGKVGKGPQRVDRAPLGHGPRGAQSWPRRADPGERDAVRWRASCRPAARAAGVGHATLRSRSNSWSASATTLESSSWRTRSSAAVGVVCRIASRMLCPCICEWGLQEGRGQERGPDQRQESPAPRGLRRRPRSPASRQRRRRAGLGQGVAHANPPSPPPTSATDRRA